MGDYRQDILSRNGYGSEWLLRFEALKAGDMTDRACAEVWRMFSWSAYILLENPPTRSRRLTPDYIVERAAMCDLLQAWGVPTNSRFSRELHEFDDKCEQAHQQYSELPEWPRAITQGP